MNHASKSGFETTSYAAHETAYDDGKMATIASTWMKEGTVDAWRHERMYQALNPLLVTCQGASWLTVGDGRCGTDAHYLEQRGMNVVATDLSDTMLKEAQACGYIKKYRKENAERLSFEADAFDFVLCKEAYHHFPRPMVALYEMLRVARKAVILIEPDDTPVIGPWGRVLKMSIKELLIRLGCARIFRDRHTDIIDTGPNWYEDVGNFGFAISRREVEKVALGLNLPQVAFKGFNDFYIEGVEHESLSQGSLLFQRVSDEIRRMDRQSARGLSRGRYKLSVSIIFKESPDDKTRGSLSDGGFEVRDLQRNPYLSTATVGS
jgi:ubiquinone/menaquinone biosynthesis C-methylase UbiE